ncbi:MAG: glycoside hydrolase family 43 protein [Bacteroidales bacterium]|jgi:beta-xylosidase|nr:glycoside hydrolase family 43 protein [Bacteroidales bacterium]
MNTYRIFILLFLIPFVDLHVRASDQNLLVADPFILEENGTYYLYGTSARDGIVVWRSADLVHWDGPCGATSGLALHKDDSWGERMFWAPEVYRINDKYVMTYSVEEHIAVAESSSPLGPFIQTEKKPLLAEKGIDSHIFIDDDGTPHLYWVRFQGGNIIYTARMSRDLKTVDMSTARHCITPEPGTWEHTDAEPRANVAEGPFVMKRGGKYYLSYSCNHYQSPDYAVGWAVADKPEGPWIRNKDNPILLRHNGYVGTGHHAFLQTSSGKIYIIYHAHYSAQTIAPRRTLISECRWNKIPGFVNVDPGSTELVTK